MQTNETPRLVTIAEAGRILGYDRGTIEKMIGAGVLRRIVPMEGMRPRIPYADIERVALGETTKP